MFFLFFSFQICIYSRRLSHRYHLSYSFIFGWAGISFCEWPREKKEHYNLSLIRFEGKNAQFCFQRRQISLTSSSMHFFSNFANISLAFVSALCSFSSHSFFVGRLRQSEMKSINWQNQGIHIYIYLTKGSLIN